MKNNPNKVKKTVTTLLTSTTKKAVQEQSIIKPKVAEENIPFAVHVVEADLYLEHSVHAWNAYLRSLLEKKIAELFVPLIGQLLIIHSAGFIFSNINEQSTFFDETAKQIFFNNFDHVYDLSDKAKRSEPTVNYGKNTVNALKKKIHEQTSKTFLAFFFI